MLARLRLSDRPNIEVVQHPVTAETIVAAVPKPSRLVASEAKLGELRDKWTAVHDEIRANAHALSARDGYVQREAYTRSEELHASLAVLDEQVAEARKRAALDRLPYSASVDRALASFEVAASERVVSAIEALKSGIIDLNDATAARQASGADAGLWRPPFLTILEAIEGNANAIIAAASK
jgi:hypothetical protein